MGKEKSPPPQCSPSQDTGILPRSGSQAKICKGQPIYPIDTFPSSLRPPLQAQPRPLPLKETPQTLTLSQMPQCLSSRVSTCANTHAPLSPLDNPRLCFLRARFMASNVGGHSKLRENIRVFYFYFSFV